MRFIKLTTEEEAQALNERVTQDCLAAGVWSNGTNNYCQPEQQTFWLVPVLDGYEQFFTKAELAGIDEEQQLLQDDIAKGEQLIQMYLVDNRKLGLTAEQSLQQLQKFSVIKELLKVGALPLAKSLLQKTATDDVLSEERKQKYIAWLS